MALIQRSSQSILRHWWIILLLLSLSAFAESLPDPVRTPGVINPNVTSENIDENICVVGWTKTVRPKSSYTNKLKKQQIIEYGYEDKTLALYEEDHLISLQLGGHPTDPKNLWPEPYDGACGARKKDQLETKLKRLVCSGEVALEKAQQAIATNWIEAYKLYVNIEGCGED